MVPKTLPHRLTALLLLLPLLAACQPARKPDSLSLESRLRLAATLDGPRGGAASVEVLREAVQQAPQDGALREKLALAAERAGRDGEAAQALREAIALLGPTPPRLMALGRLELRAGNTAAAAEAFAQANALLARQCRGARRARPGAGPLGRSGRGRRRPIAPPSSWRRGTGASAPTTPCRCC